MSALKTIYQKEPATILAAVAAIIQAFALNGSARWSAVVTIIAGLLTRQSVYAPANVPAIVMAPTDSSMASGHAPSEMTDESESSEGSGISAP